MSLAGGCVLAVGVNHGSTGTGRGGGPEAVVVSRVVGVNHGSTGAWPVVAYRAVQGTGIAMLSTVNACFVDIDATITDDGDVCQIAPDHPLDNAVLGVLRDIMVGDGCGERQATDALTAHAAEVVFWDYQDFVTKFRLPHEHTWEQITKWHDEHLVVYPDAVAMVKQLHEMGLPLYIISNNPVLGCLLKLQRAGLGTLEGTPWFVDILGPNKFLGQKTSVEFWQRAIARTGLPPDGIVVIGDNVRDDFQVPRQAGIRQFFLVDRKRAEPATCENGACFVNNLERVSECLKNPHLYDLDRLANNQGQ